MRHRRKITLSAAAAVAAASIAGAAVAATPDSELRETLRADTNAQRGTSSASAAAEPGAMHRATGARSGMSGMAGMQVRDEFDYLTKMIPHHEEAIASARVLAAGTDREDIREFAGSIISSQTAEVSQMRAWLEAWYPGRDTAVGYTPMMGELSGLSGAELDRAFLTDMIPHHGMAVMMSQQLISGETAEHDEVLRLARNIRDTQRSEIMTMAAWLRDGGESVAPRGGPGRGSAPKPGGHAPGAGADTGHAPSSTQGGARGPGSRGEQPPAGAERPDQVGSPSEMHRGPDTHRD